MSEDHGGDPLPLAALLRSVGGAPQAVEPPIVLLIGGATGTGKSGIATEVAHRLGITRVTSTDFVRQTIRAFFPAEEMPSVHYSSFEAAAAGVPPETGDPSLDGFLDQTRQVLVGVEASVARALTEGWSMVIEGIHLVPGLTQARIDGATVVHVVLHIEDPDVHRLHFHVRDSATGGVRAMDKYVSRLAEIRTIQDALIDAAGRHGVAVVESSNRVRATDQVMEIVRSATERASRVG